MKVEFTHASADDAETIANLVVELTNEISELTDANPFNISLTDTIERCQQLLNDGHYSGLIAYDGNDNNKAIAMVTLTETYALYAGGKIGVVQEFYVLPEHRSDGIGALLLDQVRLYGIKENWSCIELCTPPLPEFEASLRFYQKNGLVPVGGRKMREML